MDIPSIIQTIKASAFSGPPGSGQASSTKVVYIWAGITGAIGCMLMTITLAAVYVFTGKADLVFAGVVTGSWTALFGFATRAQNHRATTEAAKPADETTPAPPPTGGPDA